ncbi:DUF3999 family protein [Reinekea marinisedimentorum]|uniref:Uncharacterized protein DUF3999 n=1 Tax=Reinekea marinisedimentorum TaxID=230495 RepID=A0A4R3I7Z1_9GAMM|nr:DUF3999 family protein [Reinekea marinisedimentorum]TCS42362.1 uncharacterized protein DUF3999 [Reinekea marinisedimentorum]
MATPTSAVFGKGLTGALLAALVSVHASAEKFETIANPVPEDFAYGAELTLTTQLPLQSVLLPEALYREQTSHLGDDFRVFNAAGLAVSISRSVVPELNGQESVSELTIFPVHADELNTLADMQLLVSQNPAGTTIQLTQEQTGSPEATKQPMVKAYIVVLPEAWFEGSVPTISGIEFDWALPEFGFIEGINIETSADLKSWQRWISGESLSRLQWQNAEVGKARIELSAVNRSAIQRYWRVSWQGDDAVDIRSVSAIVQNRLELDNTQWLDINGQWQIEEPQGGNANNTTLSFQNSSRLPVSGLSLLPKEGNGFVAGQLYSRPTEESDWTRRASFSQYHIEVSESQQVTSEPAGFTASRDEFWKVEFNTAMSQAQLSYWNLKLAWTPQRISFIREGNEPFRLAWGNPYVSTRNSDLGYLYDLLTQDQQRQFLEQPARVGVKQTLGGAEKLELKSSAPWRAILLWGALLLGVALMAWMAVSLSRQMRAESHQA